MKKRIFSVFLTMVIIITTIAFPISVNALPSHSPANGRYVISDWYTEWAGGYFLSTASPGVAINTTSVGGYSTFADYSLLIDNSSGAAGNYMIITSGFNTSMNGYNFIAVRYRNRNEAAKGSNGGKLNLYYQTTSVGLTEIDNGVVLSNNANTYCWAIYPIPSGKNTGNLYALGFVTKKAGMAIDIHSVVFLKNKTDIESYANGSVKGYTQAQVNNKHSAYDSYYEDNGINVWYQSYEVRFETGGVSASNMPSSKAYTYYPRTDTINHSWSQTPTAEDYNFAGWDVYRDANSDSVDEKKIDTLSTSERSITMSGNQDYLPNNCIGTHTTYRLVAKWTSKKYDITWKNGDGGTIKTEEWDYGSKPSYSGSTPTKTSPSPNYYEYSWNGGWTPSITSVTGDKTYTATFDTVYKNYTVTYNGNGGTPSVNSQGYSTGSSFNLATATRQGYTFSHWSVSANGGNWTGTYSGGQSIGATTRYGNVTLIANWTANSYTVTYDGNGGTPSVESQGYDTGSSFALGTASRPGYDFSGWLLTANSGNWGTVNSTTFSAGQTVSSGTYGDATLTAQWTPATYYIVYDEDGGSEVPDLAYDVNTSIVLASAPIKSGYKFMGWQVVSAEGIWTYGVVYSPSLACGHGIYGNVTLKALWEREGYTVTWQNDDGTVLETDTGLLEGDVPEYNGATPEKSADAQYTYTFLGWTPTISPVTGDQVYTATYSAKLNTYTVNWYSDEGVLLESDKKVPYGTNPEFNGDEPYKEATAQYTYTFIGWTPELSPVEADIDYVAVFESEINKYSIIFLDEDDTLISQQIVEYGQMPDVPDDPVKADSDGYTYTFESWLSEDDTGVVAAEKDMIYYAVYEAVPIEYTITYVDSLNGDATVTYTVEDRVDIPTPVCDGYDFTGWTVTSVDEDEGNWALDEHFAGGRHLRHRYGNVTLTAGWIEEQITILYVPVGNGSVSPASETISKVSGVCAGSLALPDTNYSFAGWYADADCTVLVSNELHFVPENTGAFADYYALFELAVTDMRIAVEGSDDIDGQTYMFDVYDSLGNHVVTVALHGDETVTVKNIAIGTYSVVEQNGWSWRYEPDEVTKIITLTDNKDENVTVFKETRQADKIYWLDFNTSCENIFGKKENDLPEGN